MDKIVQRIIDLNTHLTEELKYHENIDQHKKSLEATLWGLEEQIRFPENSSKEDQDLLVAEINKYRSKISSCKKVMDAHAGKLLDIINQFKNT
jgi:hypothetical protein